MRRLGATSFYVFFLILVDESASMCESVYDEYDPFDYIYSGSGSNSVSDPVYATIASISETSPTPPLPPRVKISTLDRRKAQREQNVSHFIYDYFYF